jgi:hypothetical protein
MLAILLRTKGSHSLALELFLSVTDIIELLILTFRCASFQNLWKLLVPKFNDFKIFYK